MVADKKIDLEDFDAIEAWFPKPVQLVMKAFRVEMRVALRRIIQKLDLVTKDEYLVQKRLLDEAYKEIEKLKSG